MSDDGMEPVNTKYPCWFTFSMDDYSCGFRPDPDFQSKGILFEDAPDDFLNMDPTFTNTKPIILDDVSLVNFVRKKTTDKTADKTMPPEALEFYEMSITHASETFIALLTSFIKNSSQIQKLESNAENDILPRFFRLTPIEAPNFGKHEILVKAASDYYNQVKIVLRDIGMQLQNDARKAREKANQEILQEMQKCKQEFLDLAEADWTRLCYKTSRHNILDQRYAVRLKPRAKVMSELDEVDDSSEDDYDKIDDSQPKKADNDDLCVLSTFLYSLAMSDAKKKVDDEILRRRAQISADREAAKKLKEKQAAVNLRADSASLPDISETLSSRFARIDSAVEELKENAMNTASSKHVSEEDTSATLSARLDTLTKVVLQLQDKLTANAQASSDTSTDTSGTSATSATPAAKNEFAAARQQASRAAQKNAAKRAWTSEANAAPPTKAQKTSVTVQNASLKSGANSTRNQHSRLDGRLQITTTSSDKGQETASDRQERRHWQERPNRWQNQQPRQGPRRDRQESPDQDKSHQNRRWHRKHHHDGNRRDRDAE